MKKIIFGLVTVCLITNLSFSQSDIKNKLIVLENSLSQFNDDETTYTITNVSNSLNNYDSYGKNTYNILTKINSFIEGFKEKPDYNKDVKPFIENEIKNIIPYDTSFENDTKLIYDSYIKSFKYKNAIQISKAYENFISENFNKQSDAKDLLELISNVKFSTFATTGKRTFTVREACANRCMQATFSNFNPIQWAEFAVGFLSGSMYWLYASCWYDCW